MASNINTTIDTYKLYCHEPSLGRLNRKLSLLLQYMFEHRPSSSKSKHFCYTGHRKGAIGKSTRDHFEGEKVKNALNRQLMLILKELGMTSRHLHIQTLWSNTIDRVRVYSEMPLEFITPNTVSQDFSTSLLLYNYTIDILLKITPPNFSNIDLLL